MTTSSSAARPGEVQVDQRAVIAMAPDGATSPAAVMGPIAPVPVAASRREPLRPTAALVAAVAAAAALAGCDGDVVHVGRFHGGTTTTTGGPGEGGAGPSTTASVTGPSTASSGGAANGGAGGADAGVGGSGEAGASSSTGAPTFPEAYVEACTALCERSQELRADTGCQSMPDDHDDCSIPGGWRSSWGFCESDSVLPPECLEARAPVIACYAASVEARDCFCEDLECSYFPLCDALYEPPEGPYPCPSIYDDSDNQRCGPGLLPCPEPAQYCDFSDDLCGQGEVVGVCRPAPYPNSGSPWDDVCGCNGQPYLNLVDALRDGIDIGPLELCGAGEGGAGAGVGGAGP